MEGPVIVTTGTASGKSLAFNLPVLDTLARDRRARALYLYPTKALAQDQARKLHELRAPFLRHAIYDGDTPKEERRAIRGRSNLILTNPDMLNVGVLPHHRNWGDVLANLAWVVVDEAHVYRGVFGSHVGNVLRRLRRLARAYGTEPRFMLTSATIANPLELGERLTGLDLAPGRPRRRAARRAPGGDVEPAAGRRGRGHPRLGAVGGGPAAGGADAGRGAHDLLPQVAPRRRADPALHEAAARGRGPRRHRRADRPLPRRLHAHAAARDRAAARPRASCWRSSPPTRSSSASTSATSTPRSA